ncbi:MAG: GAF domain-containing protein [Deltaproteobacteria bacterium]|nr:GAF domain-containing protein [Deltaproteobacteria bacterium]
MEVVDLHLYSSSAAETQPSPAAHPLRWSIPFFLAVAATLTFLSPPHALMLTVISVCLMLGTALFIPWGPKEQGLLCVVTALSYTVVVYLDLTSQVAGEYMYGYLSLGGGVLVSLIGVSWQQSQRAQLSDQTAALQRKMLEAEVLQEFSRALTSALDRSQLLPPLTLAARRLCQLQGLAVGLLIPEGQRIELWTQTDSSLHDQQFLLEDALVKEILQVGWPVHITDLSHPPLPAQLFQALNDLGYVSLLVVPLRAAHRVMGVLLASWRTQRASVSRHEEELLQLLADQTIQALANIRLYAEQERHLNESETLRRVGQSISATLNLQDVLTLVAEEGARLLGCESAILTLCMPDNQVEIAGTSGSLSQWRGLRAPLAESLTGVVVRERRAIRQTEVQEQDFPLLARLRETGGTLPQSFLAVPLWQRESPMGALIVLTATPRTFSLNDERVLQALADQAVHAIANAQIHARLQDAWQREQEANRHKSAFFASASHELRTPLNIILGYVDLIREGEIGQIDHDAAETLDRVRKTVRHLITLINDLLDLARIERAELKLHREPVNVEELLDETYAQWKKAIGDKRLSFRRVGDRLLPTIITDKARLRQVLYNLLGNALKFTEAGHILLGARVLPDALEIWVEDTGSGIDPADHERIFHEFQQLELGTTHQSGGIGLGLAVCKKIAHLLQGDIRLESTPGRGSIFTLLLAQPELLTHQTLQNER